MTGSFYVSWLLRPDTLLLPFPRLFLAAECPTFSQQKSVCRDNFLALITILRFDQIPPALRGETPLNGFLSGGYDVWLGCRLCRGSKASSVADPTLSTDT